MNSDTLYDLIINFIIKGYRIILDRTDVNIRSGSVWLLLTKERENWNSFYYILYWDDPAIPGDRYKWDHELEVNKYEP